MSIPFLSASLGRLRYEARAVRSRRLNPCWNVVQPAWERSLVLLILTITVAAAGETMPAVEHRITLARVAFHISVCLR